MHIMMNRYCFLRYPCLNFNHVIMKKDFHNVFAYYCSLKHKEVKCKIKKIFYFIWCDVKIYLCKKMCVTCNVIKNEYVLFFMKVVISTKHCDHDSIWLKYDCEPCKEVDNYQIINGVFSRQWWYEIWGVPFLKIPFQMFFGWWLQTKN
jgi:hypothetical protein